MSYRVEIDCRITARDLAVCDEEIPMDKNSVTWSRVATIFQEVIDVPQEQREEFLQRACAGSEALRLEVEALLASDAAAGGFLEGVAPLPETGQSDDFETVGATGAALGTTSMEDRKSESAVPRDRPSASRVGAYRLLHCLGEGGMGSVFLAERDDGELMRQVAIKVLRHGASSPAMARRMRHERQILASLEHPGIARLYDGGTTEEGLPFLVMEYVQGEPIDRACEERQLDTRRRLEIFLEACEAVEAAHRQLVVHRDLKPSNILVTEAGHAKLLDFGIAKLLDPRLPTEIEPTASWQRLLTPSYASPEQVRGERVTTASDVYSLGVVLYEVLTGQRPHELRGKSLREVEQRLEEHSPRPPRTSSRDLDAILLKALRVEPAERYSSVEQLAGDLRSYLAGRPVEARQGNARYRAMKFTRRHWAPLATAALILAIFLVSGIALKTQRDLAVEQSMQKQVILDFVTDFLRRADPSRSRGAAVTVYEALQSAEARFGVLDGQPEVEATLRRTVGEIYLSLGQTSDAQAQLERVVELRRALHDAPSLELARALAELADSWAEDDWQKAEEVARKATEMARNLAGDDHPGVVAPFNALVTAYCVGGRYDETRAELSRQALDLTQRHEERISQQMAVATINHAVMLKNLGELEEAERFYEEALDIHRVVWGDVHAEVANIANNLGNLYFTREDLISAERLHREALELRRQLFDRPYFETPHSDLAQSAQALAKVLVAQGDLEGAIGMYRQAVDILREGKGRAYPRTAIATVELAEILLKAGEEHAVEELLRGELGVWRKTFGESWGVAWAQSTLAGALIELGQLQEAENLLVESLPRLLERFGEKDRRVRLARERLGKVSTP